MIQLDFKKDLVDLTNPEHVKSLEKEILKLEELITKPKLLALELEEKKIELNALRNEFKQDIARQSSPLKSILHIQKSAQLQQELQNKRAYIRQLRIRIEEATDLANKALAKRNLCQKLLEEREEGIIDVSS